VVGVVVGVVFFVLAESSQAGQPRKALEIYFVDVEGGQATLFVTPEGQSLLIDTGWPGYGGRDADRIVAAAKKAGLSKIDFVLLTHYHVDHAGGVAPLLARIRVGAFIDHGANREPGDRETEQSWEAYQKLVSSQHVTRIIAKVGDILPIEGLRAEIVSSDGTLIQKPLPGAGARNAACSAADNRPADRTENARSLGTIITFGKVRILDLGDLTRDKEGELVCPINKLGPTDIFIVSHHGWLQSNSPALLTAISPRIAIMDNGAGKGGSPSSWDSIKNSPQTRGPLAASFFKRRRCGAQFCRPLYRQPSGTGCGQLSASIGLGGRQTWGLQFANTDYQALQAHALSARVTTAQRQA